MALNFHQIDRALQNGNFAEHLSVIAQCARAIRENPFPLFVNALMLRIADTFQGEKLAKMEQSLNVIRIRIVKLLRECGMDSSLAFLESDKATGDELARRVMKVSHSNDYKSRSLTMLLFAAISPIFRENKKVHHLLVEGLDCTDLTELTSAIVAVGSLGRCSAEFSSMIVQKIGALVSKEDTHLTVKMRLMDDLSFFQENITVTKYCIELGRKLIRNNPDQRINIAVICALTELAKKNGLEIAEQIELILAEMENVDGNDVVFCCYLTNLLELAASSQHWDQRQVQRIFEFRERIEGSGSKKGLIIWLQCLGALAKHVHSVNLTSCALELVQMLYHTDVTVRIYLLDFLLSMLSAITNEEFRAILGESLLSILCELNSVESTATWDDRVKLYKMAVETVKVGAPKMPTLSLSAVVMSFFSVDSTFPEEIFVLALETLNILCEMHPEICAKVCEWALNLLATQFAVNGKHLVDAPFELYALALLPIKSDAVRLNAVVETVQEELSDKGNVWFAYKLARMGFRFGHWKSVSLALLEMVQHRCTTVESSTYISALMSIANAELPEKVDVKALNVARQNFRNAFLSLKPLAKNSRNSHCFSFAAQYTSAFGELIGALNTVLVTINPCLCIDPTAYNVTHMEYLMSYLGKVKEEFTVTRKSWLSLQKRSFDADTDTHQQIQLMIRYCSFMENLIGQINAVHITPSALLAASSTTPTSASLLNRKLAKIIEWGISQSHENIRPVVGTQLEKNTAWANNFSTFHRIFLRIIRIPMSLPRSFFQRLWRTNFKLNVIPQPKEHENVLSLSSRQLPLSVEGVIDSTNPMRISDVTVHIKVHAARSKFPTITDYRIVQLGHNETFFRAMFLLNIKKASEIVVNISFTDTETKRVWEADAESRLLVSVPELKE